MQEEDMDAAERAYLEAEAEANTDEPGSLENDALLRSLLAATEAKAIARLCDGLAASWDSSQAALWQRRRTRAEERMARLLTEANARYL